MTTIKWLDQEYGNTPDAEMELEMDNKLKEIFQLWIHQLEHHAPEMVTFAKGKHGNNISNLAELAEMFSREVNDRIQDMTDGEVRE